MYFGEKMVKKLPVVIEDLGLTPKELDFLLEYTSNGFDIDKAYKVSRLKKASQSDAEARLEAMALLNKRGMKLGVQRMVSSVIEPVRDRIEAQLLHSDLVRSNYDIADYFNDDGTIKPLSDLTYDQRRVIDEVDTQYYGKDADRKVIRYKLANREAAKKNLRTAFKMADGDGKAGETVPDSARTRVAEIFKAGQMGIQKGIQMERSKLKSAITEVQIEIVEAEDDSGDDPLPIEPTYIMPIMVDVIKEEEIQKEAIGTKFSKRISKIGESMNLPPEHPLMRKGREIAESQIRNRKQDD